VVIFGGGGGGGGDDEGVGGGVVGGGVVGGAFFGFVCVALGVADGVGGGTDGVGGTLGVGDGDAIAGETSVGGIDTEESARVVESGPGSPRATRAISTPASTITIDMSAIERLPSLVQAKADDAVVGG